MSHQQNSSLKKEKYMNDLYCVSSTCMLLKIMEKSRIVFVHRKKKIRAEGFAEKKISCISNEPEKKFLRSENPPYPINFLKTVYFLLLGLGNFF